MKLFARHRRDSVTAWGEERLIAAIREWLGTATPPAPAGIGDDCAVLPVRRAPLLATVDPVILGRHFDASAPPRQVAAKLLKRNLSDIAAMGGVPVAALLALALDGRTSRRWLESFYRGLASLAREYKVAVVGGDVSQADGFCASLTLLGHASGRVLTRSGARTGDWIFVTGVLGGSRSSGHHLTFTPRLAEGRWLARQKDVRAMIDVSDGLAKDLPAITPRGAEPAMEPEALPRRPHADLRSALTEGEDFELLFALAARADREAFAQSWHRAFPRVRLSCLGRFVPAGKLPATAVHLGDFRGYEHLR